MARPTSSLNANSKRVKGVLGDTAVGKGQQCVARAKVAYGQPERLRHGVATGVATWPADSDRAASIISACSCPPRLAGCRRTTCCGLCDSDEGPGAGGAGAQTASLACTGRAMQLPRLQVLQAAEEQILHCFSGLSANFAKFSFQKYQLPAITSSCQSHTMTSCKPTAIQKPQSVCQFTDWLSATQNGPGAAQ